MKIHLIAALAVLPLCAQSVDYNTQVRNKPLQNLTTPGTIPFTTGLGVLSQDSVLCWDVVNHRLGVGTCSPGLALDVVGNIRGNQFVGNGVIFALLGSPVNGTLVYCSDCAKSSPCTGGSTGAFAHRQGGAWDCNGGAGGGGAISSVFGRTGAVTSATSDYSFSQIAGNLSVLQLNGGSGASSGTFFRGDGTWATIATGGTPGGSSGQLQINSSGVFGGIAAPTGAVVGTTDAQVLSNKTLNSPILVTPALGTPVSGIGTNLTGIPLPSGITGTLPVVNGGTGANTLTGVLFGSGTSAVSVVPGTATDCVKVNGTSAGCESPLTFTSPLIRSTNTISITPTQGSLTYIADGGGTALTTGNTRCVASPYGGTISAWTAVLDQTGSVTFGVWKTAYSTTLPTSANSIVASAPPIVTSAVTATSSTLTGWTTSLSTNDLVCVTITAASTATVATLKLQVSGTGGGGGGGGGSIVTTSSTLKGNGAGGAVAVTGTSTNCVLVDGTSASCGTGTSIPGYPVTITSGTTSYSATAATHGQGIFPKLECKDSSGIEFFAASFTASVGVGDVSFTISPGKNGTCEIYKGAGSAGASGTVTSIDISVPGALLSKSGGPVTSSGTIAIALVSQVANCVLAGPTSGGSAAPTCRALVAADIPTHAHAAADITSGVLAIGRLATGTPTGSKFVRDDGTLAVPSGSGNLADPGSNGVIIRTALNTTAVVTGTSTNCVLVNGTSGSCGTGSGASSVTQLTDLQITRTNSTTLAVATGNVVVSGISYTIGAGTIGTSAGTGTIRIAIDTSVVPPVGKVYYSGGLTVTCAGSWGCTTPVAGTAFGTDDLQLGTWTTTNGSGFDSLGGFDSRGIISKSRTLNGTGLTSSTSGHTQTLAVNTSVIPIFTLSPGTGSALSSGGTITPTNRTHHVTGTSAIATVTATAMIDGERLVLIPDAAFTTTTAGNIGLASTAVVGKALIFTWDSTATKWYPSY